MRVLSLDIDGVLNRHNSHANGYNGIDPINVQWLNYILDELPDVKILIHSAWRYMIIGGRMDLKGFEYMLMTHGVNCEGRLVGHTEPDGDWAHDATNKSDAIIERTEQIQRWWDSEDRGGGGCLVAVDDLPIRNRLSVQTNGNIGLSFKDAEQIITLFREN